jgi:DNA primase
MAKYLNSPESDIYHKSDVLFGLFQARQAIRNEDVCYLAEGYLDVISLHQGGVKNVVASSGTSLTEGQIRLIQRYTQNVTVLYDGDPAGIKASLRGIDLLLEGGLNVQVVLFPNGEDPDSYIRKVGDQRFTEFIEKSAQEFISFKINLLKSEVMANGGMLDPVKRVELSRDILRSIAHVSDPLKRQVFRTQTAEKLGLDEQLLITEYNKIEAAKQHTVRKAIQAAAERENRLSSQTNSNPGIPVTDQRVDSSISSGEDLHDQMIGEADETEDILNNPLENEELEPVFDLLKACEREVLRLLVLYASREVEEEISVAGYLLNQLDDTTLKTPLYAEMWEICRQELLEGRFPDVRLMMQHEREDIRTLISDLATERYEISPNWRTKEIYVFNEVDLPKLACDNAVLRLNKVHVQRELDRAMDRLRQPGLADVEMFEILGAIKHLKQLDNQLADMLGTVIPRGA